MAFTTGEILRATGPNTAESVDLITLAALLDPYITGGGGGTGELDPIAKTTNYTLDGTDDNNRTISNGGSTGSIAFELPATPDNGYIARLARTANFAVDIDGNGKDIYWGELMGSIATLETRGIVELQYLSAEGYWIIRALTASLSGLS